MPVFQAPFHFWKTFEHQRFMFAFLERDDEVGPFEVKSSALDRNAGGAAGPHISFRKRLQRQWRHRADVGVSALDRERPRRGGPAKTRLGSLVIKNFFGKPASVIIAGA